MFGKALGTRLGKISGGSCYCCYPTDSPQTPVHAMLMQIHTYSYWPRLSQLLSRCIFILNGHVAFAYIYEAIV